MAQPTHLAAFARPRDGAGGGASSSARVGVSPSPPTASPCCRAPQPCSKRRRGSCSTPTRPPSPGRSASASPRGFRRQLLGEPARHRPGGISAGQSRLRRRYFLRTRTGTFRSPPRSGRVGQSVRGAPGCGSSLSVYRTPLGAAPARWGLKSPGAPRRPVRPADRLQPRRAPPCSARSRTGSPPPVWSRARLDICSSVAVIGHLVSSGGRGRCPAGADDRIRSGVGAG